MVHVLRITPHTPHLTPHTSHLTPHTSHLDPLQIHRIVYCRYGWVRQRSNARVSCNNFRLNITSHLPPPTFHLTPSTSHIPPHTFQFTLHNLKPQSFFLRQSDAPLSIRNRRSVRFVRERYCRPCVCGVCEAVDRRSRKRGRQSGWQIVTCDV